MKKIRLLIGITVAFLCVGSTTAWSQGKFGKDSAECVNYLNFYRDYYKQKNYKEAAPLWRKAMSLCPPTSSHNLLIEGRKIMDYLIKSYKGAPEGKQQLIDSLLLISDLRIQYYPSFTLAAQENKVFDMLEYMNGDEKKIFDQIDAIIKSAGVKVDAALLVVAMNKAKALYDDKKMSDADVLSVYAELSPIMDAKVAEKPTEENKSAQKAFENTFITSGVANCDNLITLFTPRFEANPTDKDLVKTIVTLLSRTEEDKCLQSDLFLKTVTTLNQLEPSYNSSYFLYKLHNSKNNNDEALKFLQEAIDSPESDAAKDGELLMEMATYMFKKMNSSAKAVQMAKMATDLNPDLSGRANLLMGTIWANQKCSGNEIEQRAKYWVAVDYLARAKAADATLAEEADRLISSYRQYFPKTEDAFMYDIIDGKSYSVSCGGMSATTTVRTIK